MNAKFDPSRVHDINEKLREQASETAMYATVVFGSTFQSLRAQNPRPNAFKDLIEEIVAADPSITCEGLLREIRAREGGDVILSVTDDEIEFIAGKDKEGLEVLKTVPVSGLKDRLTDARRAETKAGENSR